MRLRNNPEAKNILNNSKAVINNFPYKLEKNTVIELGMGKGEMIRSMAHENPDTTYIGVEKYPTVAERANREILNNNLNNVKIINKDIMLLPELLQGRVKTIWLTFSDPWPKAKHEKRRLTYRTFLEIYDKLLEDDGVIYLKSDNDKFFEYSINSFKEFGFNLSNVTRDYHLEPYFNSKYMTGYEKKWSAKGKGINYLEARK